MTNHVDWFLRGLAIFFIVAAIAIVLVFAFGSSDASPSGATTVPDAPGIQLSRVFVHGTECIVAHGTSSGIALSCDWGG